MGDTPECNAPGPIALHDRTDRDQREGIGRPVANLVIDVRAANRFRQRHRCDQFARRQYSLAIGRVARQAVEVGDGNASRRTIGTHCFYGRVERHHGHRHVAWMGGDARIADAEHRMRTAEPFDSGAAAAGLAFVARLIGIVEIRAARTLQQVAGRGRLIAQLSGRAGEQRTRQQPIVPAHTLVGRKIGVAHQRADAQAAVGRGFDLVERKSVDVDQVRRGLDLELHQIEEIGAAGYEFAPRRCARPQQQRPRANSRVRK